MKTSIWPIGKQCGGRGWPPAGAALLAFFLLLAGSGCAHRELLAPCSDYRAAGYTPAALSGHVPCDTPHQMHRPPWITAARAAVGGDSTPATPPAAEG